jgi:sugar phosphate isomerase/epimerase
MLAFSSCWNNSRHTDGEKMIDEILELGFNHIELSHGMTIAKLPGIQKAFDAKKFTCSGVHNYFPAPVEVMIDAPDAYEFTSHRSWDCKRAMNMTIQTLELAAKMKANYLVLHMGSVPMSVAKYTKRLTAMVANGKMRDPEFTKAKVKFIKKREKIAPLYFSRAIDALESIVVRAEELGVLLAIESRSRFEDVPTEREMIHLQNHFKDNPWIGYWHDFGHVQLKNNIGLLDHEDWLSKIAPHIIGGHLHDVEWPARDHRTPLTGELNYKSLLSYFPVNCPIVWELSSTRKTEEIKQALAIWLKMFPERCSS